MSKTISLEQLPSHVESLLRAAWEGHDSIVLERQGEPVAAVVPMEEYLRLHLNAEKRELEPNYKENLETKKSPNKPSFSEKTRFLSILTAYHSLLDKKFSSGLTADEEVELAKLDGQLDEAELATPLVQSTLTTAEQQHKQWMRTLDEVITRLRGCLNRAWLRRLRLERNQKQERLNEVLALQEELEQTVANRSDPEAEVKLRLLSFLRNEIEALQRELQFGIPFITLHEESDAE